jgi:hypothetical protein
MEVTFRAWLIVTEVIRQIRNVSVVIWAFHRDAHTVHGAAIVMINVTFCRLASAVVTRNCCRIVLVREIGTAYACVAHGDLVTTRIKIGRKAARPACTILGNSPKFRDISIWACQRIAFALFCAAVVVISTITHICYTHLL